MAEDYGTYLGAAHPYREDSNIWALPYHLLKQLSFIDLNGKDYAEKGKQAEEEVSELAKILEIPITAGSDTHQAFQYDYIAIEIKEHIVTVDGLIRNIQAYKPIIHVSHMVAFKVQTASMLKKALKEIYALGGNYTEVLTK